MSNMETLDLRQQEGLRSLGFDYRLIVLLMVGFLAACGGEGKKDKKGDEKVEREAAEYCMSIEKWLTDRSSNFNVFKPSTVSADVISSARDLNTACQNMKLGHKDKAIRDIILASNSNSLKVCLNKGKECDISKSVENFSYGVIKNSVTRECYEFFHSIPGVNENQMKEEIDMAYKICSVTHFKANKHSWQDFSSR